MSARTYTLRRLSDGKEIPATFPSRNGRWASNALGVLNIATNQLYPCPINSNVADDGSVVACTNSDSPRCGLARPGRGDSPFPLRDYSPWTFLLDREARNAAWVSRSDGHLQLMDTTSGSVRTLLDSCNSCSLLSLSGDGRRVLFGYSHAAQSSSYSVLDTSTLERTDLNATGSPALTNSGKTVCYLGPDGALRCLDLDTGATRVLVEKTASAKWWPYYWVSGGYGAPGGRYDLTGTGLRDAEVRVNGSPVTVLSSSDTALAFILPLNLPLDTVSAQAIITVDHLSSPFEPDPIPIGLLDAAPRVITLGEVIPFDMEGDLRPYIENGTRGGLATDLDPLLPGESVWIHMGGLGRDPQALSWRDGNNLPLVPEGITYDDGWYTVKIRIPEGTLPGIAKIGCVPNERFHHIVWVDVPVK